MGTEISSLSGMLCIFQSLQHEPFIEQQVESVSNFGFLASRNIVTNDKVRQ